MLHLEQTSGFFISLPAADGILSEPFCTLPYLKFLIVDAGKCMSAICNLYDSYDSCSSLMQLLTRPFVSTPQLSDLLLD